jgi:hypothetical protein
MIAIYGCNPMSRLIRRSQPLQILCLEEDENARKIVDASCQLIGGQATFADCGPQEVKLSPR